MSLNELETFVNPIGLRKTIVSIDHFVLHRNHWKSRVIQCLYGNLMSNISVQFSLSGILEYKPEILKAKFERCTWARKCAVILFPFSYVCLRAMNLFLLTGECRKTTVGFLALVHPSNVAMYHPLIFKRANGNYLTSDSHTNINCFPNMFSLITCDPENNKLVHRTRETSMKVWNLIQFISMGHQFK